MKRLFAGLFISLLFCGCSSLGTGKEKKSSAPEFDRLDETAAAVLRSRTADFMNAMSKSFSTGDFEAWRKAVEKETPPGSPPIVDEKRFKSIHRYLRQGWGNLVKCTPVGELDQSVLRDFLWKCTFEQPDGSGGTVRTEELFVIRCTVQKGQTVFANFGFRFFNKPGFYQQIVNNKKTAPAAGKSTGEAKK